MKSQFTRAAYRLKVLLLLCSLGAPLMAPAQSQTSKAQIPVRGELLVGQSASFSGSFAAQAASYRDGALSYFHEINQRGGISGRAIRLISLDDGYVVERAVANTKRLVEDENVLALVHYTWTNTVKATVSLAAEARIAMFAPYTGYEELYATPSPVVFTTRASFSDELEKIITHLRTIGVTRIALLHYDSPSGKELLEETRARVQAASLTLSTTASMKAGSKDPTAAVQALRDSDAQALILGASGSDAVAFVKAHHQTGRGRVRYYARSLIGIQQMVVEAGELVSGLSVTQTAPNPLKNSPVAVEYRRLLMRYKPEAKPDYIGLEGMIAAKVFVEGLRRAGPAPTRASLLSALKTLRELDVGGYQVQFSPTKHHGSRHVDIMMVGRDGRIID